jgi:Ala-tRNA(Pro) deacylase
LPEIIDASSKYQDSLPVTSDDVLALLDAWGIAYTRADHVPLRTVEDSKKVQDMFLPSEEGGGPHQKPIFAR